MRVFKRITSASFNAVTVRAVVMETWKAFHSCDGPEGSRNTLGSLLFDNKGKGARPTRSQTAGVVPVPLLVPEDTFVVHAANMWNSSPELRAADNVHSATAVARAIAAAAPI